MSDIPEIIYARSCVWSSGFNQINCTDKQISSKDIQFHRAHPDQIVISREELKYVLNHRDDIEAGVNDFADLRPILNKLLEEK